MIVIGSEALRKHGIETGRRKLDIDVVGEYDDIVEFAKQFGNIRACYPVSDGNKLVVKTDTMIVEGEITWEGSNAAQLRDLILNDPGTAIEKRPNGYVIPSVNLLYMLKMSHRYLRNSPHFLKTMRDIQMLRLFGAKIEERHEEFYKERMRVTYDYGHPKLDQSKKDFFSDDGIKYVYDHDSIHEAVKQLDRPAYTYYKPDQSEVNCSKDMFFSAPEMVRLLGGLEESYVLALERSQIPFPGKWTPQRSFDFALMKVCTSITSGWFREYCWENYDKIRELYDDTYVDRFWQKVEEGVVIHHDPQQRVYG
jgi:biotin operon repressor